MTDDNAAETNEVSDFSELENALIDKAFDLGTLWEQWLTSGSFDLADKSVFANAYSNLLMVFGRVAMVYPHTRWVIDEFYNGGSNIAVRLDHLHNERNPNTAGNTDTRDENLALDFLNRAGVHNEFVRTRLSALLPGFFFLIGHPDIFVNPNARYVDERK